MDFTSNSHSNFHFQLSEPIAFGEHKGLFKRKQQTDRSFPKVGFGYFMPLKDKITQKKKILTNSNTN